MMKTQLFQIIMQKLNILNMDQFQAYSVQKSTENVWSICEVRDGWERHEKKM